LAELAAEGRGDALARDPEGWTSIRSGTMRLLAARRKVGCRLICWDPSPEPRSAAIAVLRRSMPIEELVAGYGNAATLLEWLARGRSKDGRQDRLFGEARAAQIAATAEAGRSRSYRLRLGGLPPGARLTAEAVREIVRSVPLATAATEVRFDLNANEVMRLDAEW
jgi:hypothetical protein